MPDFNKMAIILMASLLCSSASASAQVISELPNPHAATCIDFKHHKASGSWSPRGEIQITSSSGTVSLSPSNSVTAGHPVGGYDIGKWLDTNCHKSSAW